jgi:hypothetical protein
MSLRNFITVVTSTRPHAGRTFVARLLADFYMQDARKVAAFDLNGGDTALSDYLPAIAAPADISEIYGQIALFDRLAANDGTQKVIDLGLAAMKPFFAVMQDIDLAGEMRRAGTATIILFVATPDDAAAEAFAALRRDIPAAALVPVHNAYLGGSRYRDRFAVPGPGATPVHVPVLTPGLRRLTEAKPFSFNDSSNKAIVGAGLGPRNDLHRWLRRVYVEFREMELRILLDELQGSLGGPLQ